MRSIFRYPGGKTRRTVREWIIRHRPERVLEYREPFVGGGGIFFAMPRLPNRWINDKHEGLIAVYTALRDRPAEFIERCREIEPARSDDSLTEQGERGGRPVNKRLKEKFDSLAFDDEADAALRYFFVNRTVFGGRVNYDLHSRLYFSNEDGWNIVNTNALEFAATHVADTRITCGDYAPLLSEPGEEVWIYADPPYVVNTDLDKTSQLYQHGFTHEQHREFAAAVAASPHKVCVSYDDDDEGFIRSLYPEDRFRIVRGEWAYCGTTNEKKEVGKELLILNYDPPMGLLTILEEDEGEIPEDMELLHTELERRIESFRMSFMDAGEALREIRNRRTYRLTHGTFEDYCRERWGMSRQQAHNLISAAEVVRSLSTIVDILPTAESQARELTRLEEPKQQIAVWKRVLERTKSDPKRITAKIVRQEVEKLLPESEPDAFDWRKAWVRLIGKVPESELDAFRAFVVGELNQENRRVA